MNRRAYVQQIQAPADLSTARYDLVEAMNTAEQAGAGIPCKTDPVKWTSDSLLFDGSGVHEAAEAMRSCSMCPALAECNAFLEASIDAGVPLFGVVAGQITSAYHASLARRRNARRSA